ncbi:MAG: DUF1684 domain-containing protein [Kaistella sp.]|nr:DUF1684 domain-containing protein [Kaistella sp.]
MKKLTVLFLLMSVFAFSQSAKKHLSDIQKFQVELNREYKDAEESPLRGDSFRDFKGLPFFPVNLKYRVTAKFIKTENAVPFQIQTSSGKTKPYREYGKATFKLDSKEYTLTLFQSLGLITQKGYEDYLFLPFRDATNGKETYGGGKYMDLRIPKGKEIILDFNKSYQPFCAYNAYDYSCPVVPEENTLPVKIEAGVMYNDVYHH